MARKNKSSKAKGSDFEEKVIATINSGALSFDRGDAKDNSYVYECKYTDKLGFRITKIILEKLWNSALESNKLPRLIIGLPKNEVEMFILTCNLTTQKR